MTSIVSKPMSRLHERGMSVLLVLLLFAVFVVPNVVHDVRNGRLADDVMLSLILISGVVAVADHRRMATVLAVLSVVVIGVRWSEWIVPSATLPVFHNMSALSAMLVLACTVGINVFAAGHAISDRVFGAVVLYLLLGLIWAVAYSALNAAVPGTFAGVPPDDYGPPDWIYFSFVTLTTVGYGDVTAVTRGARTLAILEALIGQLYPAVIIARLVSLQASK